MKIVIDGREWNSTTGRYVSSLVQELEKLDDTHDYTVLLMPDDINSWQPEKPNFSKVACPHKEFTFDEQLGLKKQLDSLAPDLVHFPIVQQPVWYRGKTITTMNDLTTMRFKNPSKNQIILTAKQQVYGWVNKKVARKADALITYSEYVKQDVANFAGVNPDKITVINLAAKPITSPAEAITSLKNAEYIMYIGRPMPHKNLPRLIEAFTKLKLSHPRLKLVLAGKKDVLYEQIEQSVNDREITDVVFTGFVSEGQLRWLYENCAAYIFPSLSEGFGLPGLEAMTQGAPVISSNATCLPEIYGDAALYFEPLDVANMTQKISQVLDDSKLREKLIRNGLQQVKKYSWEQTARQTLDIYNQILGETT